MSVDFFRSFLQRFFFFTFHIDKHILINIASLSQSYADKNTLAQAARRPCIHSSIHVIAFLDMCMLTMVPTSSTWIPSWCHAGTITCSSELTFFAPPFTRVPGFAHELTADKGHLAFLAHLSYLL